MTEREAWSVPANRHENQIIRVADLVVTKMPPLLVDQAFINCQLIGPAVLMVLDDNTFEEFGLEGPGALWQLDDGREYIGGIGLQGCLIRQCKLTGIGLAGNAVFVQKFMDHLRGIG